MSPSPVKKMLEDVVDDGPSAHDDFGPHSRIAGAIAGLERWRAIAAPLPCTATIRALGKPDLFDQALGAYRRVPADAGRSYVRALIGMGRLQLQRTAGAPRSTPEETSAAWRWLGEARQYFDEAIRLAPENYIARRDMADAWR